MREKMVFPQEQDILTIRHETEWEKYLIALDDKRPFMRLKPSIGRDGNQWCFLLGDNLAEGVAGFGDTPELAAIDFDITWLNQKSGVLTPMTTSKDKQSLTREEALWWCTECNKPVDSKYVTFEEYHDGCGGKVISKTTATAPIEGAKDDAQAAIAALMQGNVK